ncbi:MAG: metallophosphoesterase [[Clostridium] innocuum]
MKLLMLHLSDFHFKDDDINKKLVEEMAKSLVRFKNVDRFLVVCSGDIANTAKNSEYAKARTFFAILTEELNRIIDKYIPIYIVPGNHDLVLNEDDEERYSEIKKFYSKDYLDKSEILKKETKRFSEFCKFSSKKRFDVFKNNIFYDVKWFYIDGKKIKFNFINSSFFSSRTHNDKDFHYFDTSCISNINQNEYDYNFTIMHHTPEWFHENYKNDFEKIVLESSDIIFYGHNHLSSLNDNFSKSIGHTIISCGGVYYNMDHQDKTYFNVLILDTDNNEVTSCIANWNSRKQMYKYKEELTSKIEKKNNVLTVKDSFIKELLTTTYGISLKDLFVFPDLKNSNDETHLKDLDSFIKKLGDQKIVNITGQFNSGKSALLRYLYCFLKDMYTVIYIEASSLHNDNIVKCIKNAFEDQYSEDSLDYERFLQISKDEKLVIIDDVDKIKINGKINLENLMNKLEEDFSYFIYSSHEEIKFDLKKEVKDELNTSKKIFRISPFYKIKRKKLISNILSCEGVDDIENTSNKIEATILNSAQNTNYTPDLIIQYSIYSVRNSKYEDTSTFNTVFEANIVNKLQRSGSKDIDEFLMILSGIAFYLHSNRKTLLSDYEILQLVEKYNKEFDGKIKGIDLISICVEEKILYDIEGQYEFINKQSLAFFIARYIRDQYLNDDRNVDKEIDYLLNNLCFGINSEIYLFVVYFLGYKLLLRVDDFANELMNDWTEFSFSEKNLFYLYKKNIGLEIDMPKGNEKKESERVKHKIEEKSDTSYVLDYSNIYDYDEAAVNDYVYKMTKALKYLELLARGLPIYYAKIGTDYKNLIIDSLYSKTNKLIYMILKPLDHDFENIVEELMNVAKENGLNLDKDELSLMMIQISLTMVYSIYFNLASLVTNKKTIVLLNTYLSKNKSTVDSNLKDKGLDDCYLLFNLIMRETRGDSIRLLEKSNKLYDKTQDINLKYLIKLVLRNHIINHPNMEISLKDRMIEKYFSYKKRFFIENERSKLLVLSKQREKSI